MAYEVEAITTTSVVDPASLPMKSERTFSPYEVKGRGPVSKTPLPPSGQDTKGAGGEETFPSEETVKLSPQVAALARKEQKFRQQQQELEKEKATVAAEKAELAQLRAMKEKLAAKDYSALEGQIDYNEYSQYQVNKAQGSDPVQEKLKAMESKISEMEKFSQENVSKQFEAAVQERRIAATKLVDEGGQFPRIKKAKAHEAVVQHILDTWEHDNEELSIEQAAKEVEELLVEKANQWKALLEDEKEAAEAEAPPAPEKKALPPLNKPSVKTLTNQVTAADFKPKKSFQGMSDSERWAEARRRALEKQQQS